MPIALRAKSLKVLAQEIQQAHEQALASARTSLQHARRAGEMLLCAKAKVGHGDWLPWLKKQCPRISERTAQVYMQISARWSEIAAQAQSSADLSIGKALSLVQTQRALPAAPEKAIEVEDVPREESTWLAELQAKQRAAAAIQSAAGELLAQEPFASRLAEANRLEAEAARLHDEANEIQERALALRAVLFQEAKALVEAQQQLEAAPAESIH
jgi:hypothetical protein